MDPHRAAGTAHGVNTSSNKEETAMDTYLKSKGLYRKKIAKDGSCLFRAVAEQVLHSQARHLEVRKSCIKYLQENRNHFEAFIEGSFEEYLQRLNNPQEWVGQVEISALSLMFKKDFIIYQEPNVSPARVTDNGFSKKILLCFSNGNHYDLIYPTGFAENAALCQSVIYELLYKKVFGVDVGKYVSKADVYVPKPEEAYNSDASESDGENEVPGNNNPNFADMNGFKSHKDGKFTQTKDGFSAVPPTVLCSLNPAIYRNVEYDVWMKSQRDQQKLDFSIAAGMQYSVGDKCKVRLESGGVFYNAHIQEVGSENGPAVVFVEELGQRHVVHLKNLKPASFTAGNTEGWSTVAGKKLKKPSVSGPAGQFEKGYKGQRSSSKTIKTPYASLPRLQPAPGKVIPSDHPAQSESKGRSGTPPKLPARKFERDRIEESSYGKRESVHFGLTPEERKEKQFIEESKSLYEIQNRDTDAFPALSPSVVDATVDAKKIPMLNVEKSTRRKSELEDQKTKASHLAPPVKLSDEKLSEEAAKPLATSAAVLHDVTVLPTHAEQQPPTTVPSVPPLVTPWSGISAQMPASPGSGPVSDMLQPQVTSAPYSPHPVSMPAVNQPLLPMPQTLSAYQDPLYPGFPMNEKGERATAPPPYSLCKNGDDLPSDKSILHFFYNLGIKAYMCPMWPPYLYLHPLHQAYLNICRMYPNIPVYPQSHWVPEATINQGEVDPSVFTHQSEFRSDNHTLQPECSPAPLTPPDQVPVIGGLISPHLNESAESHSFQPQGGDIQDSQAGSTVYPQLPFGQSPYMGHLPIASPFFPHVWYGYPYQGFIENTVVRHNVYISPQDRDVSENIHVSENISAGGVVENKSVHGAIKQSEEFVAECKPDMPLFPVGAGDSGSSTSLVKEKQAAAPNTPHTEQLQSLTVNMTDNQVLLPVKETPLEGKECAQKEIDPVHTATAQINVSEQRSLRAREESSEDEREVSNMLSSGRSKNFYNQSYGSRRPRNDKFYPPNRGGYQYSRNEEGWRGYRGREDGFQHHRSPRGRTNRRRPMGDAYRPQYE